MVSTNLSSDTKQRWILIAVLLILVLALILVLLRVSNHSAEQAPKNLLLANSTKGELYITDLNGQVVQKLNYPKNSYINYQSVTNDGTILVSLNSGTPTEVFMLIKGKKIKQLPETVASQMRNSVIINGTHQFNMVDANHVLMMSCQNETNECKLTNLDINSGTTKAVLNTGNIVDNPSFPEAYLLIYSTDDSTAVIKIDGKNKLSSSTSSIYKVDIKSGRVTKETKLPAVTGYSFKISHDQTKAVYYTGDINGKLTFYIRQLDSGKETKLNWGNKGVVASGPQTFVWSPDDSKVLTKTASISISASQSQSPSPSARSLMIDTSKQKIVELSNVQPADTNIINQAWLDDGTIIYDTQKTTSYNPASAIYKLPINDQKAIKINSPDSSLVSIYSY